MTNNTANNLMTKIKMINNSMWVKLHWIACKFYILQTFLKCNKANNHITVQRESGQQSYHSKVQCNQTIQFILSTLVRRDIALTL